MHKLVVHQWFQCHLFMSRSTFVRFNHLHNQNYYISKRVLFVWFRLQKYKNAQCEPQVALLSQISRQKQTFYFSFKDLEQLENMNTAANTVSSEPSCTLTGLQMLKKKHFKKQSDPLLTW